MKAILVNLDPHARAEPYYWLGTYLFASQAMVAPLSAYNLYAVFKFEAGRAVDLKMYIIVTIATTLFTIALYMGSLFRSRGLLILCSAFLFIYSALSINSIVNGINTVPGVDGMEVFWFGLAAVVGAFFLLLSISAMIKGGDAPHRHMFAYKTRDISFLDACLGQIGVPVSYLRGVIHKAKAPLVALFCLSSLVFSHLFTITQAVCLSSAEMFRLLDSYCNRIIVRAALENNVLNRNACYDVIVNSSRVIEPVVYSVVVFAIFILISWSSRRLFSKYIVRNPDLYQKQTVVFLRPFSTDSQHPRSSIFSSLVAPFSLWIRPKKIDEILVEEAAHLGTPVCISNPSESVDYGAVSFDASVNQWQASVATMLDKAKRIFLILGDTEGVKWELGLLTASNHLNHSAICVSPACAQFNEEALRSALTQCGSSDLEAAVGSIKNLRAELFGIAFDGEKILFAKSKRRDAEVYRLFFRTASRPAAWGLGLSAN